VPCPEYDHERDVILTSRDLEKGEIIRRHFRFKRFVVLKDIKFVTEPL